LVPRHPRTALFALCLLAAVPRVLAGTVEYALDLPADRMLTYRLEFEVAHPGLVTIDAEWAPLRVLVLRLERPGQPTLRRSGPPPHHVELEVGPDDLARDEPWTLAIHGLPSREPARGRLVIGLPESPEPRPPAPAPYAPEPEPWMLPVAAPPGLRGDRLRFHGATERFRAQVAEATAPDAYRWQDGMLRFLVERRDRDLTETASVDKPTRILLRQVVEAVGRLDELRRAESEPLSGPPPDDRVARRAWLTVRDPRFAPVEEELDTLLDALHRGHAPELEHRAWFSSFLSCLIVCERHFEERARLGPERANNRELVDRQWDRVLAATDALRALTELS